MSGFRPSGTFEVGFKDGAGVQRWRTVQGGVTAARALRDELLTRRGRGERVASNPRLRFGEAADRWLAGPVLDLRETTQAGYRNAVERHLRPRYVTRRLDAITADDVAVLMRELRDEGLAETTIASMVATLGRVYRYAARRPSTSEADRFRFLAAFFRRCTATVTPMPAGLSWRASPSMRSRSCSDTGTAT